MTDEELKAEIRKTLIEVLRTATKKSDYIEMVCKECGKRQRVQGQIRDNGNVVRAASELLDRMEGKAATKREVPKPKTAGRSLDELTDAELEAILASDYEEALINGEAHGEAAEEAAE